MGLPVPLVPPLALTVPVLSSQEDKYILPVNQRCNAKGHQMITFVVTKII